MVALPFDPSGGGVTSLVFKVYTESSRPARSGDNALYPSTLEAEECESLKFEASLDYR